MNTSQNHLSHFANFLGSTRPDRISNFKNPEKFTNNLHLNGKLEWPNKAWTRLVVFDPTPNSKTLDPDPARIQTRNKKIEMKIFIFQFSRASIGFSDTREQLWLIGASFRQLVISSNLSWQKNELLVTKRCQVLGANWGSYYTNFAIVHDCSDTSEWDTCVTAVVSVGCAWIRR